MKQNNCANVTIDGKQYNSYTEPPALLREERKRISFPVRELTYYFYGGKDKTEQYEKILEKLERDPLFDNSGFYDMDYETNRELTFKQVGRLLSYLQELGTDDPVQARAFLSPFSYINPSAQTRLSVHTGLFAGAVATNGTPKQYEYWVKMGMKSFKRFYGCFGMTELGHGSNVAGMETTATFDKQTDEFVINTPTTAATKWWIGGAAHSANFCNVLARLIVDGKDYGVQNFIVQLRSTRDHSLMPGVAVGDIGKKMGRDGIDNGWIQFTDVRIPRTWMLQKFCKVSSEGKVEIPPLAQLAYGALINGRVSMAYDSYIWARRFLTIAIRYAACRRQFSSSPNEPETVLLDYPYHQRRLIPLLAQAIAIEAASSELFDMYSNVQNMQASVDLTNKAAVTETVNAAKELFALSAGLKAFGTWACAETIDECRQACGGHGYSGYNGFGQGYNDWVVNCTWEGDNNVLCLSAGRALIQNGLLVAAGKKVSGPVEYLNHAAELKGAKLGGRKITDPKVAKEVWHAVASQAIMATTQHFQDLQKKGVSVTAAFEELSSYRFLIARLHTRAFQVCALLEKIAAADASVRPVLQEVANLFNVWAIVKEGSIFLQYGVITPAEFDQLEDLVSEYCLKVRNLAIGICDSFNLGDFLINAPIGNYDGDIYKNYFGKVKERKGSASAIAPYYKLQKEFFSREADNLEPLTEI